MTTSTTTGTTAPDHGAQPGREHEIARLHREMKGTVFGYFRRRLYWVPLQDIEELTSEVFMVAINAWAKGPPPNPEAWLMSIAGNILLAHFQRVRRSTDALDVAGPIGDYEPVDAASPDPSETNRDGSAGNSGETLADDAVGEILEPLRSKPRQAEAVRLRFAEGREVEEIAESIGVNPRTFRNHSDRGITFLRQHYNEESAERPGSTS